MLTRMSTRLLECRNSLQMSQNLGHGRTRRNADSNHLSLSVLVRGHPRPIQLVGLRRSFARERASSILFRFGLVLSFLDQIFDLLNEHRQIRASKTHLWCGNTVVLDVGRDVLVVGRIGHAATRINPTRLGVCC